MSHNHRRAFLRQAAAMSSLGVAGPLGLNLSLITNAAAQSAPGGYRALVCIFLAGGNDAFNTVLATDDTSWGHYADQRISKTGGTSIGLPKPGVSPNNSAAGSTPERLGGVLPISHAGRSVHAGRSFALHPAMPQVQALHQAGRVAVLANVGPLTRPTSKSDWADARASKPAKLFSHNDQASTWQSFKPEGASQGWAGLMGDALRSGNGSGRNAADAAIIQRSFTCMTPSSATVWLAGRDVSPYQSGGTDVLSLGYQGRIYGNTALNTAVAAMMGQANSDGTPQVATRSMLASDHQHVVQRALQASALLGNQVAPLGVAPWSTTGTLNTYTDPLLRYTSPVDGSPKFNPLALQLQMVARLIDTNRTAGLGLTRQFFMVTLGGFDTHGGQIGEHADRMAQVNHALAYFDTALRGMPAGDMRSQVTTFTASEFGRGFISNGSGTDHGWGAHHFIMGGAVKGTEVYGSFPQYSSADANGVFSSPDQIQNGAMLPSTSVDQLAFTLGRWMGVADTTLRGFMPALASFDSSVHDLGFMKA